MLVLEGLSDSRQREDEAVEALRNLRTELDQGRANLSEILAAQRDRDVRHRRMDRWLADWDRMENQLVTTDEAQIRHFRTELLGLHEFGLTFIVLLTEWGQELDSVIGAVDGYLGARVS